MSNQVQKQTNIGLYEPKGKEKKLLETLINPDHRTKSITKICEIANCSRNTYYKAISKPEFNEMIKHESEKLVKSSIGKVINTFVKEAERGSFQHGKALLEMAGMYKEQSEHHVKSENINKNYEMTDEEIREFLEKEGINPDEL